MRLGGLRPGRGAVISLSSPHSAWLGDIAHTAVPAVPEGPAWVARLTSSFPRIRLILRLNFVIVFGLSSGTLDVTSRSDIVARSSSTL